MNERAAERDALLHAARQLVRPAAREADEPDQVQQFERPLARLAVAPPFDLHREQDIVERGAPRQQVRRLEHEAEVVLRALDDLAAHAHDAGVAAVKPPTMRSNVVFPQPLGPSSATSSPRSKRHETSSSATTSASRRLSEEKTLRTCSTTPNGSVMSSES